MKYDKKLGREPKRYQMLGEAFTFSCGCSGVLPKTHESNLFAVAWRSGDRETFRCRVAEILRAGRQAARKHGYASINPNISHLVIRQMEQEKNCVLCREPLKWELGRGITPHLHHDHETGAIHGFSHMRCNPFALQSRVWELETENTKLKLQLEQICGGLTTIYLRIGRTDSRSMRFTNCRFIAVRRGLSGVSSEVGSLEGS